MVNYTNRTSWICLTQSEKDIERLIRKAMGGIDRDGSTLLLYSEIHTPEETTPYTTNQAEVIIICEDRSYIVVFITSTIDQNGNMKDTQIEVKYMYYSRIGVPLGNGILKST